MSSTESGPPDGPAPPEELLRFIDRFDRGEYWLAHEELEALWLEDRADFYKGLIHLAAALVHAGRDNWRGAARKAASGSEYLQGSQPEPGGFDLDRLRQRAGDLRDHLEELASDGEGADVALEEELRPRLRELFRWPVPEGIAEPEEVPYRVRRYEEGYRPGRNPAKRKPD